jgi:ADP-ribose pyrophosphatase YjhB (NUDIX family)
MIDGLPVLNKMLIQTVARGDGEVTMSSAWALIEDDGEVLFVRRALDLGRGGQWCPPGGTIWEQEWPEVACVREVYEETGLRVTVREPIAVFESAHFFLCTLNEPRESMSLRVEECIDAQWTPSTSILDLGTVMDLRRIIPVLDLAGFSPPTVPDGLSTAVPHKVF